MKKIVVITNAVKQSSFRITANHRSKLRHYVAMTELCSSISSTAIEPIFETKLNNLLSYVRSVL